MMMMRTPDNDESTTTPTTETTNEKKTPTEDLNKNYLKRLAKKQNESFSDTSNVAAYVVVLRDNRKRSSKSSRLRRKRSAEYVTLEPIDESSLDALRKTYKNSLKEITLNPNETPAEALMRYNAAAIREALDKANKHPMEISAGEEVEEAKGSNANSEVEQHQHVMQQRISKSLPQTYTLSQFVPVTTSPEAGVINAPYAAQPLTVAAYDSTGLQGESYNNNIITKYHTPEVYSTSNKYVAQNPYLHVHTPLESASYLDNNNAAKQQPYQLTNHATVDSIVYQSPQLSFSNYLSTPNAINKNLQQLSDYEIPATKSHQQTVRHLLNQNTYTNVYGPPRQTQVHTIQSYRSERPQDSLSLDNIISLVKQQLVECCDKCKNDILQSLDETLKRQQYANTKANSYNTLTDTSHTLTYRTPTRDEDFEYKQWLSQMSNKGYSTAHLTKQHHQDYLKDGKLNLHIEGSGQDFRHEVENIFFKNNQSFKRETILPETKAAADKETGMVTAAMTNEDKTEKPEEDEEGDDEDEDDAEVEDDESGVVTAEEQIANEAKANNGAVKIKKETDLEAAKNKNDTIDAQDPNKIDKQSTSHTSQSVDLVESTTHSMYNLRGKFRPSKPNTKTLSLKQSKKFANYKNIKKLGNVKSTAKSNVKETNGEKLDELLDILHDISNPNRDNREENFSTVKPSATTSTISPLTTSAANLIWKADNGTELVDESTSKKSSRNKSKSRKSLPKLENIK